MFEFAISYLFSLVLPFLEKVGYLYGAIGSKTVITPNNQ